MSAASKKVLVASVAAIAVLAVAAGAGAGADGKRDGGRRDKVAPTAAANLRVTSSTSTSVSVAWDASTDNVGVKGYYVYIDGNRNRSSVAGRTYTAWPLDCGESVGISVVAIDHAGNRSPPTDVIASTAACPDMVPPTPPTGLRQAATAQDAVVLAWDPSTDNLGVVGYGVYRGGLPVASTSEPTVTLSGLRCASTYAYEIDAVDAAGNRSRRSSFWAVTAACADEEPPSAPTDLTVTDETMSSVSLAWAPSSDNVGVAGYRLLLGGVPVATALVDEQVESGILTSFRLTDEPVTDPSQPSATISDLACATTYAVGVEAYDAAGNSSPATTVDAATESCPGSPAPPAPPPTTDTTPPSVPTNQTISGATQTSFVMSWGAATDNLGVTGYSVYLDGVKVATVTATSYTYTALTCGMTYTVALEARDAAGNVSNKAEATGPASTLACTQPGSPGDTTSPAQPGGLAVEAASQTTVSLTWLQASDDVGVEGYGVYVDGTRVATTTQLRSTVSSLTCGTAYTFEVDAYDAAGNRSGRAGVTSSTSACPDTQRPTAPTNVTATSRTTTSIALSWSASSDDVGVTGYALYQDGALVGTTSGTTGIFFGLTCNTSYTLAVEAYDASGNRSEKTRVLVSTTACPDDIVPPSVPTNQTISGETQTGFVMAWSPSTDNVAVTGYNVYLDGVKVDTVTTTSYTYTALTCGSAYNVALEARDAAGNVSNRAEATGLASTLACDSPVPQPPPAPSPPPPSAASLYVSSSGSDANPCTQLLPCASFQRAYVLAAPGAVVEVAGGTYPAQRLSAVSGKAAPNVEFRERGGHTVILGGLSLGSGEASEGPDYITVRGMEMTYANVGASSRNQRGIWVGPGSTYITLIDMDAGSVDSWFADHLTVLGGDYGPCNAVVNNVCGNNKQDVSTNVLIDGAVFHDLNYDPSNIGAHWECMYINGGTNVTIRGNRFERCAIFDLFVTISGPDAGRIGHENLTIENNFFAPALDGSGNPSRGWSALSVAWCHNAPQPAYRNIKIRNNSFAPGATIERDLNADAAGCVWQNVSVTGNSMAYQEGCQRGWTYAYNGMGPSGRGGVSGTCSSTDKALSVLPYVDTTSDFHLAGLSVLDNLVPPAECPATDIDGQSRPMGPNCDAGADER